MKKLLMILLTPIIGYNSLNAQVIKDTVSLEAGYKTQKWYSLEDDEQGSSSKNNWDIAFDCSGFGSSISINSITGTTLWKYPKTDTSGWASVDTVGINTWNKSYNSDTSWTHGAFDKGVNTNNPMDLGWGMYSTITHIITGDSIYIIKLSDDSYKKLWIESLNSGVFTFKFDDIAGGNLQQSTLTKSNFNGKILGYYSLQTNQEVDREPLASNWDLTFCQYTGFIPSAYTVSGILSNPNVKVAQVNDVSDVNSYNDWESQTFVTPINEIGYDWKSINMSTHQFDITDSMVYFVKTNSGDVWKVIPTEFGGSANGNFIFTKEKITTANLENVDKNSLSSLNIYPNPSNTGNVKLIYDLESQVSSANLSIYDLSGKIIFSDSLENSNDLNIYNLNTYSFNQGCYYISLEFEGGKIQQKLIIQ